MAQPGDSGEREIKCRKCGTVHIFYYFVYPDGMYETNEFHCQRCSDLLFVSHDETNYSFSRLKEGS